MQLEAFKKLPVSEELDVLLVKETAVIPPRTDPLIYFLENSKTLGLWLEMTGFLLPLS